MSDKYSLARDSEPRKAKTAIGCMLGKPAAIVLHPDAVPYNCITARRVPIPLLDKVKEELKKMEREGVIKPVSAPSDWCAPMVPVLKPDGRVRICVDLKKLNASVKRELFPLPTVEDTLTKLRGSKIFSTLDLASGFWQIPLEEEASHLTTFITPFGRYRFLRLPFGITSAPEIFQSRLQLLLDDIPGTAVFIDDITVFSKTVSEHNAILSQVQTRLKEAGLTLNERKCHYSQQKVKYLGHIVSAKGIEADPAKQTAIAKMPVPSDADELRRGLGMFTYLSKFLPALATVATPLRSLLVKGAKWHWGKEQDSAFSKLKQLASTTPCLAILRS